MTPLPQAELLRQILRYDAESGKLFWLTRRPDLFKDGRQAKEHSCAKWNTLFAGKEAFTATNRQGYKCGAIFDRQYKAHRIAWALYHGIAPEGQIDHIDGDRTNNRISNLRDVTNKENSRSACIPKNNTTGYMGVSFTAGRGMYRASIKVDGRQLFLGYWKTAEEASNAYTAARDSHGFSARHGTTRQP